MGSLGGFGLAVVGCAAGVLGLGGALARGQATTLVMPPAPLLPAAFGQWKAVEAAAAGGRRLEDVSSEALKECGERRVMTRDYVRGGRVLHLEAMEFSDATGAFSAMTLAMRPGMRMGRDVGRASALGGG